MMLISLIQKNWLMIYVEYTRFDAEYEDFRRVQYYYCVWWYHLNRFYRGWLLQPDYKKCGVRFLCYICQRNLSVEYMSNVMYLLVVSEGIILWWVFIVFGLVSVIEINQTWTIDNSYPEPLFDWIWLVIAIQNLCLIRFDWL